MEILSETEIDINKAKEVMKNKEKERELIYEQNICMEYLEKIPMINDDKLEKMKEELKSINILKPRYIVLICNILPDTEEEVENLFSKERTNLKKEEITQIVNIIKKYK